jgi:hypothetical protein
MFGHKKTLLSIFVPVFAICSIVGTGYAVWYFDKTTQDVLTMEPIKSTITSFAQTGRIIINSNPAPTPTSGYESSEYASSSNVTNFLIFDENSIDFTNEVYVHYIIDKDTYVGKSGYLDFNLSATAVSPKEKTGVDEVFGDYVDIACRPLNGDSSINVNKDLTDKSEGITKYTNGEWYKDTDITKLTTSDGTKVIGDDGKATVTFGFTYHITNISCSYVVGVDIGGVVTSTSSGNLITFEAYKKAKNVFDNTDLTFNFTVNLKQNS